MHRFGVCSIAKYSVHWLFGCSQAANRSVTWVRLQIQIDVRAMSHFSRALLLKHSVSEQLCRVHWASDQSVFAINLPTTANRPIQVREHIHTCIQ